MTTQEAYEAGCLAGWTHAFLMVLSRVKLDQDARVIIQELAERGPADPIFGLPKTIITRDDAGNP